MKARAARLGEQLDVVSAAGKGTEIRLTLPLRRDPPPSVLAAAQRYNRHTDRALPIGLGRSPPATPDLLIITGCVRTPCAAAYSVFSKYFVTRLLSSKLLRFILKSSWFPLNETEVSGPKPQLTLLIFFFTASLPAALLHTD
jgi:hypothetical protein